MKLRVFVQYLPGFTEGEGQMGMRGKPGPQGPLGPKGDRGEQGAQVKDALLYGNNIIYE